MKKVITLIFILFCLITKAQTASQLTVTTNSVAAQLAQAIEGSGVTISNATLHCDSLGLGSGIFSYPSTASPNNLGLVNGILLTTGHAAEAANAGTYFCDVATGNNFTDSNLIAISANAYNDVCILQFDIIPGGDTMSIKYIFSSEEYPTYVDQFNDAFGFFLTGPNPVGGTYNAQNIAILPGIMPVTPVSINNVNDGYVAGGVPATNPSFFHDNYTAPNNDIAYDGYTIPITSVIPVVASATYHIKIAIADAYDEVYDSGVFIQDGISSNQTGTTHINRLNKQDNNLIIYPNPNYGSFVIEPNTATKQTVMVYDVTGKLVLSKTINGKATIDASNLSEGVYNISISNNEGVVNKKLVIVK